MMTQMELLSEGFWDMFKLHKSPILRGVYGAARAATKGGEYLARTLTPEITRPIDQFGDWATGMKDAMRQGYDLGKGGNKEMLKDLLMDHGWIMDTSKTPVKRGSNMVVLARKADDVDENGNLVASSGKLVPIMVDKHGNITNSAYLNRNSGQNPAYPSNKK